MRKYLTLVTWLSLAVFYGASAVLAKHLPAFALGVDDGSAARHTLALALGITVAALPLWRIHWQALRRLWVERWEDGRGYLLLTSSLGVVATAATAAWLVSRAAGLVLGAVTPARSGLADLLAALLLFILSWLLWRHHWWLLSRPDADTALCRVRIAAGETRSRPGGRWAERRAA
jgi:hypothetical protein